MWKMPPGILQDTQSFTWTSMGICLLELYIAVASLNSSHLFDYLLLCFHMFYVSNPLATSTLLHEIKHCLYFNAWFEGCPIYEPNWCGWSYYALFCAHMAAYSYKRSAFSLVSWVCTRMHASMVCLFYLRMRYPRKGITTCYSLNNYIIMPATRLG